MSDDRIIDFEEELSHYQPSLEVSAVGDAIVEAESTPILTSQPFQTGQCWN